MSQPPPGPMHPPQETKPRVDPLEPTRRDTIAPCEHDPFDESTPMRRVFKRGDNAHYQAKSPESVKKLKEFLKSSLKAKQRAGAHRTADLQQAVSTQLPFSSTRVPLQELFQTQRRIHQPASLKRLLDQIKAQFLRLMVSLFQNEPIR